MFLTSCLVRKDEMRSRPTRNYAGRRLFKVEKEFRIETKKKLAVLAYLSHSEATLIDSVN